ncbi:redoxin domain-containing protein [candidate division GN15 bacterium]|nr:redoxin domain-containing protein [candidate division GN15 bacterium]
MASSTTATIDQPAPDFTLTDSEGTVHSLSDFKGQYVILEWINFDCPFVKKHYSVGNMQKYQTQYQENGAVWLSICSSAPGKQGYFEGEELTSRMDAEGWAGTAYLADPTGKVGKMYGATNTPHMYVINPEGVLVYAGAIDDTPSTKSSDIPNSVNYVEAAMTASMNDQPIDTKATAAYGCSVKYP